MITKDQIKKIHILKNKLGLSDEEYGAALEGYGATTSKELSYEDAQDFILKLEKLLPPELKKMRRDNIRRKYDELGIRYNEKLKEHYATPRQLRMIEAMWMTSRRVHNKTEAAFFSFVKRITGKERLEWLLISDIRKIVKAIKSL